MIRIFSFLFVLLVIGFASGYAVFAASTVGEHSSQTNTETVGNSDGSTVGSVDCPTIADGDVKPETATGGSGSKGGESTGSVAK